MIPHWRQPVGVPFDTARIAAQANETIDKAINTVLVLEFANYPEAKDLRFVVMSPPTTLHQMEGALTNMEQLNGVNEARAPGAFHSFIIALSAFHSVCLRAEFTKEKVKEEKSRLYDEGIQSLSAVYKVESADGNKTLSRMRFLDAAVSYTMAQCNLGWAQKVDTERYRAHGIAITGIIPGPWDAAAKFTHLAPELKVVGEDVPSSYWDALSARSVGAFPAPSRSQTSGGSSAGPSAQGRRSNVQQVTSEAENVTPEKGKTKSTFSIPIPGPSKTFALPSKTHAVQSLFDHPAKAHSPAMPQSVDTLSTDPGSAYAFTGAVCSKGQAQASSSSIGKRPFQFTSNTETKTPIQPIPLQKPVPLSTSSTSSGPSVVAQTGQSLAAASSTPKGTVKGHSRPKPLNAVQMALPGPDFVDPFVGTPYSLDKLMALANELAKTKVGDAIRAVTRKAGEKVDEEEEEESDSDSESSDSSEEEDDESEDEKEGGRVTATMAPFSTPVPNYASQTEHFMRAFSIPGVTMMNDPLEMYLKLHEGNPSRHHPFAGSSSSATNTGNASTVSDARIMDYLSSMATPKASSASEMPVTGHSDQEPKPEKKLPPKADLSSPEFDPVFRYEYLTRDIYNDTLSKVPGDIFGTVEPPAEARPADKEGRKRHDWQSDERRRWRGKHNDAEAYLRRTLMRPDRPNVATRVVVPKTVDDVGYVGTGDDIYESGGGGKKVGEFPDWFHNL